MRYAGSCAVAICLLLSGALYAQDAQNILWDGGFETGFGNAFWAVERGNYGASYRHMWKDGVVQAKVVEGTELKPRCS